MTHGKILLQKQIYLKVIIDMKIYTTHLNTSATSFESSYISINGAVTGNLVTDEVSVMRAVDPVVAERLIHILIYILCLDSVMYKE